MSVSLFTGVETFNWQWSDFDNLAAFCKKHGVTGLFIKIYEITTGNNGDWYAHLGGSKAVLEHLKAAGIQDVIGYGFYYGNNPVAEGESITNYLRRDGRYCIDVEDGFDGQLAKMENLINHTVIGPGQLYVSTWANPVTHGYSQILEFLERFNVIWMPQIYDDFLLREFFAQWVKTTHPVQPTFHILNNSAIDARSFNGGFSLWEYQFALQRPDILDLYVAIDKGEHKMTVPQGWNDNGTILTAPNGITVRQGFRDYILNHNWDAANVPNELEYAADPAQLHRPDLGKGTRQTFRDSVLWWTSGTGVVNESQLGNELSHAYAVIAEDVKEDAASVPPTPTPTPTPAPTPTPMPGVAVTVTFDKNDGLLQFLTDPTTVVYQIRI